MQRSTPGGITGIEVREVRGIGWSVVTTWLGKVQDRARLFPAIETANEYAQGIHGAMIADGPIGGFIRPYLKLAEAPDGSA